MRLERDAFEPLPYAEQGCSLVDLQTQHDGLFVAFQVRDDPANLLAIERPPEGTKSETVRRLTAILAGQTKTSAICSLYSRPTEASTGSNNGLPIVFGSYRPRSPSRVHSNLLRHYRVATCISYVTLGYQLRANLCIDSCTEVIRETAICIRLVLLVF